MDYMEFFSRSKNPEILALVERYRREGVTVGGFFWNPGIFVGKTDVEECREVMEQALLDLERAISDSVVVPWLEAENALVPTREPTREMISMIEAYGDDRLAGAYKLTAKNSLRRAINSAPEGGMISVEMFDEMVAILYEDIGWDRKFTSYHDLPDIERGWVDRVRRMIREVLKVGCRG
jgi:hypothetical protein